MEDKWVLLRSDGQWVANGSGLNPDQVGPMSKVSLAPHVEPSGAYVAVVPFAAAQKVYGFIKKAEERANKAESNISALVAENTRLACENRERRIENDQLKRKLGIAIEG